MEKCKEWVGQYGMAANGEKHQLNPILGESKFAPELPD